MDAKKVLSAIKAGNGKRIVTIVAGEKLIAAVENGKVVLTDGKGGKVTVLKATNGVTHVIDVMLLPEAK